MTASDDRLFNVSEIAAVIGTSSWDASMMDQPIYSVTHDSRQVSGGELFVALEGDRTDGHTHVLDALDRGAVAALVRQEKMDMFHGDPRALPVNDPLLSLGDIARWYRKHFDVTVIGITGSVGKTTCKDLLAGILQRQFKVVKNSGNYNTEVGVPHTLFKLRSEHDIAVVEMAMRGLGDIDYLAKIADPEIGVLTNITESHIEVLGSQENIARAKAELFEYLSDGDTAVLDALGSWMDWVAERTTATKEYYAGQYHRLARVWAENVRADEWSRAAFDLCFSDGKRCRVALPLAGVHHVSNALAAACTAHICGVPADEIADGLRQAELSGMRMQWLDRGDILIIDDAYNSSPTSCRAALETLSGSAVGQRKVAVLADMLELGDYARKGHREIGRILGKLDVDIVVTVGDLAHGMGETAVEGGFPGECHHRYDDNASLVADLEDLIRPGDVVLVKGSRGCRLEEVVRALKRLYPLTER